MVGDTPVLMRTMSRKKQIDNKLGKSVRWKRPGEALDALLADEPKNDVAGVDVPDTLQATIISIHDYRKAQQSDEEVCDVKNKLEILSRGMWCA